MKKRRALLRGKAWAGALPVVLACAINAQAQTQARTSERSSIYNWSGFYAGVNAGYAVGANRVEQNTSLATNGGNQTYSSPEGVLGGGQIGFNWQVDRWVWGLEADAQASSLKDGYCFNICDPSSAITLGQSMPWFATLRGRFGYTQGASLFYATGGAAMTKVKTSLSLSTTSGVAAGEFEDTRIGWTAGAGVETALGHGWSGKIEYLYADYGRVTHQLISPSIFSPIPVIVPSDIRTHTVRLGLNYNFAGGRANGAGAESIFSPSVRTHDWSGVYFGGNIGYAAQRTSGAQLFEGFAIAEQFRMTPGSLTGGAQVGANWQINRWVFGVEADYQGTNHRATNCFDNCDSDNRQIGMRMSWFATTRARFGYAAGSALFYATGGTALTSVQTDFLNHTGPVLLSQGRFNDIKVGWTAGGGIETALGGRWSAKAEYLYLDFGNVTHMMPVAFFGGSQGFSLDIRDHVFRMGVNYKIGG